MIAFIASAGLVLTLVGCGSATRSDNGPTITSLADRTLEAGSVTVKPHPRQLDADGAVFTIIDTHEIELDQDMVPVRPASSSAEPRGPLWHGQEMARAGTAVKANFASQRPAP